MPASIAPHCLCFGLSGPVGRALRRLRQDDDAPWLAISRQPPADAAGVRWQRGELPGQPAAETLPPLSAVLSLGPLDAFAAWFAAQPLAPARVIALSSTSVRSKRESPDPAERALAQRLHWAEQSLRRDCTARGSALLILRPTLIYGEGSDRSLTRAVALARRFGWLPLSRRAVGRRMPVHAADLAQVVIDSLRAPQPRQGSYELPGGEILSFAEMLRRTLAVAAPAAKVLELPDPLFRIGLWLARRAGLIRGATAGMLSRLDQDLLADAGAARRDLGYAPRPFQPEAVASQDARPAGSGA